MREITHLLVLPIPGRQRTLEGLVSIELRCSAFGKELPWGVLMPELKTLMAVGSLHVANLPAPHLDSADDLALPVSSRWLTETSPLLRVLAQQQQILLLTGPTGSGKSWLAKWLHRNSPRRDASFVEASLRQLPNDTGLSHLFGWKKGAFTDADRAHVGWVTQAEGGTLFLDDVDTLSAEQQFGLLGFLDGRYQVGGGDAQQVEDVRLIFATNADLPELVDQGLFREDLFHRINVFMVDIPPLSERVDEVPEWAVYFASNESARLSSDAVGFLASQTFPGNLRDIGSCIARANAFALVDSGGHAGNVVIGLEHCERAVETRRRLPASDPVALLHRTAQGFLEEALKRPEDSLYEPIIKSKGLLYDMIWLVAVQQLGDTALGDKPKARIEVARLIGKTVSVKGNNYGSELRKAFQRLSRFYGAHGSMPPRELVKLLGSDDELGTGSG